MSAWRPPLPPGPPLACRCDEGRASQGRHTPRVRPAAAQYQIVRRWGCGRRPPARLRGGTGLVDAHVPRLAACLGDGHELVRRQALALLAHLLQKARPAQPPPPPLLSPSLGRLSLEAVSLIATTNDEATRFHSCQCVVASCGRIPPLTRQPHEVHSHAWGGRGRRTS